MSLVPPAVKTKSDATAAPKAVVPPTEKAPKVKAEKAPADPNAPKKERTPKKDYGYSKLSTIKRTEKESKMRGARGEWLANITKFDGKTVAECLKAYEGALNGKGKPHSISGWMNLFAKEGYITLTRPPVAPKADEQK